MIDRTTRDLTNHLEQDHSGIKQRTPSVGGSRVSCRRSGSVGSMMRCVISFVHAPGGTSPYHEPGNEPCMWAGGESAWQRWQLHKRGISAAISTSTPLA